MLLGLIVCYDTLHVIKISLDKHLFRPNPKIEKCWLHERPLVDQALVSAVVISNFTTCRLKKHSHFQYPLHFRHVNAPYPTGVPGVLLLRNHANVVSSVHQGPLLLYDVLSARIAQPGSRIIYNVLFMPGNSFLFVFTVG